MNGLSLHSIAVGQEILAASEKITEIHYIPWSIGFLKKFCCKDRMIKSVHNDVALEISLILSPRLDAWIKLVVFVYELSEALNFVRRQELITKIIIS